MNLQDKIKTIKGIGEKTQEKFNKLGIYTIHDFIHNYPIRYEDRSKLLYFNEAVDVKKATVKVKVVDKTFNKNFRKKSVLKLKVVDHNNNYGDIIYFNQPYLNNVFKRDQIYFLFGSVEKEALIYKMVHPEYMSEGSNKKKDFLSIKPIYSLTEDLKQWKVYKIYENFFKNLDEEIPETLHPSIVTKNKLCSLDLAIKNIHFPDNKKLFNVARYRLIFEEFFDMQLGLIFLKNKFKRKRGISFEEKEKVYQLINDLPFELTESQLKVIKEIIHDMKDIHSMNRIVQGDVGSDKTIVGLIALYLAYLNGYQGALMAPTEILAEQHYKTFKAFFKKENITIDLLTSSVDNKEEKYTKLRTGTTDIVIGTHALIQPDVHFSALGLVITDEQHRFGVRQRSQLSENTSTPPDVLVMSATPIPRTLSMVLYGDLEISTIDELPKGRQTIDTFYVSKHKRKRMYEFIKKQLNNGRQAYIVCPLVEESDELNLISVEQMYDFLKEDLFKNFNLEYIHGKMNNEKKESIMKKFSAGDIDLLVSTTVIEVGIDVPNANIMVIENVERFGLSQLHQLRGRVGRGEFKSYCFLLSDHLGDIAKQRVKTMISTNDGFKIAKKDLELRGPGELLGLKQHGIPEFKIADIIKNNDILLEVQTVVKHLIKEYNKKNNKEIIQFVEQKSNQILKNYSKE